MKIRVAIIAGAGLALAAYVAFHTGFAAIASAVLAVGGLGFAVLCLYALGLFLVLGTAWYVLLPDSEGSTWRVVVWARMVRDAATEVLPFSHLGGLVLSARAAMILGISQPLTVASMIVDLTAETIAQLGYVALGVMILCAYAPRTAAAASLSAHFFTGLAIATAAGGLLLVLQRHSHWIAGKLAPRLFHRTVASTMAVSIAVQTIYRRPARVGLSMALHFAGWILSAIGTWIAFRLTGARVNLTSVLAIESLVYALRSVAFIVPNALGVQEAAYVILAPLFGVGPEFGLAISVLKRTRDVVIGVPILLACQGVEGRRAMGGGSKKSLDGH